MSNANYLTTQLRESAPYLIDAGWRQTAELLIAAADEIEALRAQLLGDSRLEEPAAQANENAPQISSRKRAPAA